MDLQQNVSLKSYNTLAIDVTAAHFLEIKCLNDLRAARDFCQQNNCPWLLLGGGSNLVLTANFDGLVMLMCMHQVTWPEDAEGLFTISAEAGYEWDALVSESVRRGASGLENLSLIPGQVGAAPIQNIGAYGVEVKQFLDRVQVFDFDSGDEFELSASACELGYRDSIFKRHSSWIVTQVELILGRGKPPQLNYGVVADTVTKLSGQPANNASPQLVRDAIIYIRRSKLPDPIHIPNVGSFFKNPVINAIQKQKLIKQWPGLVAYPMADNGFKLAAGWLIDQLGWKGFKQGGVGVHDQQALVLICSDTANGWEVLALAQRIQADVEKYFGVKLEVEPRLFDNRGEFKL
ncbi:MAG: UDP-N-acetylmuramate dehydrogenase [Gammaproteobacteria bacterium]|nr:UDP-N-acetylmuramate dehydrogenase [Gammaproteobacteria bacterium]